MNSRKTYIYNLDQVAIQEIRIKVVSNRGKQTVLKKLMIKYKSIYQTIKLVSFTIKSQK